MGSSSCVLVTFKLSDATKNSDVIEFFFARGLILNELDPLRDMGRFTWLIVHYVKRLELSKIG